MKQLKSYKLILFIGFCFVTDITSASSKNKFDGSGMICPAENAVASNIEKSTAGRLKHSYFGLNKAP